ncbi:MAG: thiamine pyrophosphate-dependent dehydrogenase E1 component subunit alpha [Candidatus Omnitrophica bacterium]|nr:thiamine pyrophosphate-dependent dehydrogenase E1 component subunit alpha [Candidatus Omnitrophota bacterium]
MNAKKDLNVSFYKKMYMIRVSEEQIQKHYHEDEMKTPTHMSMGAEAIAVGVCSALKETDQVFGTYRSHALYLAKTADIDDFFAEMYGKATALLKGKGGSMHLCAPRYGFMITSAIVASNIPVGVGAAFANKYLDNQKMVVVFFGDGAVDEGAFWESLNAACLMKIPILFIYEDNGYAVHSSTTQRHGYLSITEIVKKFNCLVKSSYTTDVEEIYDLTLNSLSEINKTEQPAFLHLKYYRYLEHVGVFEDFKVGYRDRAEFEKWKMRDPVILQRDKLIKLGFSENELLHIEKEINDKISQCIANAKRAPFADETELHKELY